MAVAASFALTEYDGVDSSATIFSRACAYGGLWVYGTREYYSNIKGEHSYFKVRVSGSVVRSHVDRIDLLAAFDEETVIRHSLDVAADGGIIFDPAQLKAKITAIPTLERRFVDDISTYLSSQGLPGTLEGVLEAARRRGVHLYPLPYSELLAKLSEKLGGVALSTISRTVNVMAVAASFALTEYDGGLLEKAIRYQFGDKPRVVEMNLMACGLAHDYVVEKGYDRSFGHKLSPMKTDGEARFMLQGTQAVGLGKILAGCRVQTYYPITPATDESEFLEARENFGVTLPTADGGAPANGSILVMQTEDEIAAITFAVGASLAGARAATSTSGPGFSLMMEGLGWSGMNEVPVVVTLYQRAGPSTGLPTRHEQGDLRFALHAGHGEFPRIILASGDISEAMVDVVRAFNYAERYQCPVIHMLDKALANSVAVIPRPDLSKVRIDRGALLEGEALLKYLSENPHYKRFRFVEDGVSPRVRLGTPNAIFWNTGDEHDEAGHISEDPVLRRRMMEKRMGKLEKADREIPLEERVNVFGDEDADTLILSWGSTKGAILDAMEMLGREGVKLRFIQLRVIHPFPTGFVREALESARRRVAVEMNYSAQLAGIARERTGISMDHYIVKYTGRPMSCEELYAALKAVVTQNAPRRVVLTHGA
jgi:2-oxoglutarate ferredoxin oxidoreductase subunit alpha